jgi:hypothetical protein
MSNKRWKTFPCCICMLHCMSRNVNVVWVGDCGPVGEALSPPHCGSPARKADHVVYLASGVSETWLVKDSMIGLRVSDRGGSLWETLRPLLQQKPFGSSRNMWAPQCGHCGKSFRFISFNENGFSLFREVLWQQLLEAFRWTVAGLVY